MALDRQSIEKRDFPIGRRGYEPEAVDEHLSRLAGEIEALKRSAAAAGQPQASSEPRTPESLAAVASQQVAAIVQAAEATSSEIEREARALADRIRSEAEADAAATRDEAISRSRAHVGKVSEATALMLQRVDAMENELSALTESLRTGATRLQADLALLQGGLDDLYGGAAAEPVGAVAADREVPVPEAPAPAPIASAAAPVGADDAVSGAAAPAPAAAPPAPEPVVRAAEEEVAPVATPAGGSDEDVEGARLIALNLALNGNSREETDKYLADNFDLVNRQALLDEVYASIE